MSRSGTYSYFEAKPAGDSDQQWTFVRCNGNYIVAITSRMYSSSNRGLSWIEETPHGSSLSKSYKQCDVNASGQMIVSEFAGRLHSKFIRNMG